MFNKKNKKENLGDKLTEDLISKSDDELDLGLNWPGLNKEHKILFKSNLQKDARELSDVVGKTIKATIKERDDEVK